MREGLGCGDGFERGVGEDHVGGHLGPFGCGCAPLLECTEQRRVGWTGAAASAARGAERAALAGPVGRSARRDELRRGVGQLDVVDPGGA